VRTYILTKYERTLLEHYVNDIPLPYGTKEAQQEYARHKRNLNNLLYRIDRKLLNTLKYDLFLITMALHKQMGRC